jgi:hypothetical protein
MLNTPASEGKLDSIISIHKNDVMISQVLNMISREYGINFSFSKTILPLEKKVNIKAESQPVRKILDHLFVGTGIRYTTIKNHVVLIFDPAESAFNPDDNTPEDVIISSGKKNKTLHHPQHPRNETTKNDTVKRDTIPSVHSISPLRSIPLQPERINVFDAITIDSNILNEHYTKIEVDKNQGNIFKLGIGGCYDFYYNHFGMEFSIYKPALKNISFSLSANLFPSHQIHTHDEQYDAELNQWNANLDVLYHFALLRDLSILISGGYQYSSKTYTTSQVLKFTTLYGDRRERIHENKEQTIYHGINTGIISMYQFHNIFFYLKYNYSFSGEAQSMLSAGFLINFHKKQYF